MRNSIFKLMGLVGGSLAAVTQTQAPAITGDPRDHPAKPWNTDYCIEHHDILSALTISQSDDCENCYLAHFKDDSIDISVPENLFKDEHYKVYAFIHNEIKINRPQGATGNVIAMTWSKQNFPQYDGYMQLTHFWLATSPKVEKTLDAKMWFELTSDAFPEFIHADLCITPPWESSTYQSTTTDAVTTTPAPVTTPRPIGCTADDLAKASFRAFDARDAMDFYDDGQTLLVTCADFSYPTMNREKAGAKCVCSDGECKFVGKKSDFKCIPESVCPLPDFQGAKFNYVIDAEQGGDWAYMRFRFRKILDNMFHPEWHNEFWANSPWTGIVACPFSSNTRAGSMRPLEGIYFESGSSAYNGTMHTIMGRSGHHLKAEKGETLRAAILTPEGAPWETKFKGYTCEVAVWPGHHPNLATCLEKHFGDYIYEHFQTEVPK